MEDFNLKLQDIDKDNSKLKVVIRFLLSLSLVFLIIFISIKILNSFYKEKITDIRNIPLIKNENEFMKIKPEDKGGLLVDNLDIGVYNVIDDKEENSEIKIIKTSSEEIKNKSDTNITKEEMLSRKIDEIVNDMDLEEEIYIEDKTSIIDSLTAKNETPVDNTSVESEVKQEEKTAIEKKVNITINTKKEEASSNIDKLNSLGNKALIDNLKNKKDIKPGIKIQLLASKSKKNVMDYWNSLQKKYINLFKDLNYYLEEIKVNNSDNIYRLKVGIFKDEKSADNFCKEYIKLTNKNKIDCIISKSDVKL